MTFAPTRRRITGRLAEEPWIDLFHDALTHCQNEEWELGLADLTRIFNGVRREDLPGRFYSYLGYGAALCHGQVVQGIKLCRRAIGMEFYQPENYFNLARTALLAQDRKLAHEALAKGLAIDPTHPDLLELESTLGRRRGRILPFLARGHFLNRLLGHLRPTPYRPAPPPAPGEAAPQNTTVSSS